MSEGEIMLNIRTLSQSLQRKAFEELNEIPANIQSELEELRNWLFHIPHLRSRIDDQFLVTFLRSSKHNVEKAMKKIEMFYTCRTSLPELMMNRDPTDPKILEIIRLGIGLPLPLTDRPDSPRVILIRPGAYDATRFRMIDIMKVSVCFLNMKTQVNNFLLSQVANMICDILLIEDDNFVICGEVAIVDFKNVTKSHLLQLDPLLVKKLAVLNQEGSPMKQCGIHYVHTPPGFDVVFNLFKSIMQSKNLQTEDHPIEIVIHPTTHETIFDHISRQILPTEYGGNSGSIAAIIKFWEHKLISYREYFLNDGHFGTDETKRPTEFRHHHADFVTTQYD